MVRIEKTAELRNPIRLLAVACALSVAVLAWLGWSIYGSYCAANSVEARHGRIAALKGRILRLDEVLTMSARMAAATGDLRWEARYRSFEPELDDAIQEAMAISPEAYNGKAAAETGTANVALVAMENRAFDLVRSGRVDEATHLLFSDEYERQKTIYAQGMTRFAVTRQNALRAAELRGTIVHLDEVLTMSARMASVTGDSRWEARYRAFAPLLYAAIDEASVIDGMKESDVAGHIKQMGVAKAILVKMEADAFTLVRAGQLGAAQAILSSEAYEEQRAAYGGDLSELDARLKQVSVADALSRERSAVSLMVVVVVALFGTAGGWLAILRMLGTWQDRLVESNRHLAVQGRDLAERSDELRKLSVVVEQSPASIVITDTKGVIEYVNSRFTKVTGYTKEEVIGRNPRILKSGKRPKSAYERLWKTILAGETWRGELENKKKNGDLHWEAASISPVRNPQGETTHFLAVKEDISDRKRREEELRKSLDELERFSRMAVGRELRMIQLKEEVNELLVEMGRRPAYRTDLDEAQPASGYVKGRA